MEFVEDLGAKVSKCSYINEYIIFFCNIGQAHPLTINQYSGLFKPLACLLR